MTDRPHQVDQFLMDNPDNLLLGTQRFENLFTNRFLGDGIDEIRSDIVGDVRFQQCLPNLLHAFANIALGDLSGTPESTERLAQTLCD